MEQKPLRKPRTKSPEQALASLMRLCARAEKSQGDARRLMRGWGLDENDARRVLDRLIAERFIDDSRYAAAFVREKLQLSGWGEYKIRAALQRKGIARETIDEVLDGIDGDGMRCRLLRQLERKARTTRASAPYELKTKLMRYGLSLGYDYPAVADAVDALIRENDSCDTF